MLGYVGPMLAYVGPMLSHLGGYVGHMLGYVGYLGPLLGICYAIYVEKSSATTFYDFSFPQSKSAGKNFRFLTSPS